MPPAFFVAVPASIVPASIVNVPPRYIVPLLPPVALPPRISPSFIVTEEYLPA